LGGKHLTPVKNPGWRLHFHSEPPGRDYVVMLKNGGGALRKRDPKVAEAKRVDFGGTDDDRRN